MVHLDQNLVGDLGRQRAIFRRVFEEVIGRAITLVAVFKDEGLAHEVIGFIVQIFGGESSLVNPVEIQLALMDVMLFDELNRLRFIGRRHVLLSFGVLTLGCGHLNSGAKEHLFSILSVKFRIVKREEDPTIP